jgi:flagellar export protein FliJ
MARFVFEFEAVLKQRLAEEREKQLAMAVVERERIAIEDQLRGTQQEIESEKGELRAALGTGAPVDLATVRQQAGAALGRVKRAQQLVLKLAGVHKRLDAARLELLLATTRRKAMDTLKEKRLEAWNAERNRLEANAMDEITIMRAARMREGGIEPAFAGGEEAA